MMVVIIIIFAFMHYTIALLINPLWLFVFFFYLIHVFFILYKYNYYRSYVPKLTLEMLTRNQQFYLSRIMLIDVYGSKVRYHYNLVLGYKWYSFLPPLFPFCLFSKEFWKFYSIKLGE